MVCYQNAKVSNNLILRFCRWNGVCSLWCMYCRSSNSLHNVRRHFASSKRYSDSLLMLEEYHCRNSSGDDMEEVQFMANCILFSHISLLLGLGSIKNAVRASYKDALRIIVINLYIESPTYNQGASQFHKTSGGWGLYSTFEVIAMNIIGRSQSVITPVSTLRFIQPLRNLSGPCRNQNR